MDIAVANRGPYTVTVLLNAGGGVFTQQDLNLGTDASTVSAADFNGDGIPDLAVGDGAGIRILLGVGNGTFGPAQLYPTAGGAMSTCMGDFNADGRPDLAVSCGGANVVSVMLGRGDGTFERAEHYGALADGETVAAADVNGDGQIDLVVGSDATNLANAVVLLNAGYLVTAVTVSGVSAEAHDGVVAVKWSAFVDTRVEFQVLRSTSRSGPFEPIGSRVAGAPDVHEFGVMDASALPSTNYFYKVGWQQGGSWGYSGSALVSTPRAVLALRVLGSNPTSGPVQLRYELARAGQTALTIVDLDGRSVRTVVSNSLPAGTGTVSWDGRNNAGRNVAAGIYFARLSSGSEVRSLRIVIVR